MVTSCESIEACSLLGLVRWGLLAVEVAGETGFGMGERGEGLEIGKGGGGGGMGSGGEILNGICGGGLGGC